MSSVTNQEVIAELMAYSRHGALMHAFVFEALQRYADVCIAAGPEAFDQPYLCGAAWHGCAVEVSDALKDRQDR